MHYPPPPPHPKFAVVNCAGCGASHNQEKCPYCGTARKACNCNSAFWHDHKQKKYYCCVCGKEIIPIPAGSCKTELQGSAVYTLYLNENI